MFAGLMKYIYRFCGANCKYIKNTLFNQKNTLDKTLTMAKSYLNTFEYRDFDVCGCILYSIKYSFQVIK